MLNNSLRTIQEYGQSIWQDFIRRKMILSGDLRELIENDGIRGVTSNPAIFESVIDGSRDYDDDISTMALQGRSAAEIYESLTVEVNPHLARDVNGTLTEAHRLWKALDRPNVMIKVPGTRQGLTCIRRLISEGVNINVTLLFGLPRYREVAETFIDGLEARAESGKSLKSVASVASFFLSRIDVMVDPALKKLIEAGRSGNRTAERIYGQVAIASARCAYQIFKELFHGGRFRRLAEMGARPQRGLWASTSTKEPEFSDIKYVEALIGPATINTLPRKTIDAYRAHGRPARRLDRDPVQAWETMKQLARLDIDIDKVTQTLVKQGIDKFVKPYDRSLQTIERARRTALRAPMDRQVLTVADDFHKRIKERLAQLQGENFSGRLWEKDASLWSHDPGKERTITGALGWLDVVPRMHEAAEVLAAFRNELLEDGYDKVTLIAPPGLAAVGMWLEQLMAESTGKGGTGLLPVAGESLAPPAFYGSDRVFVQIRLESEPDERLERSVSALRNAGHPVIAIRMEDRLDLAQEFIRWEIATATVGAVLGINPFDQPNVQESKDNTDRLLDTVRGKGRLPDQTPRLTEGPLKLYLPSGPSELTLIRSLARFFEQVRHGDYIALLAYLTEEAAVETLLNGIRLRLQQHFKTPVTMGYGPRYLHSTGQFHKGGPDTGLFVQLTADDRGDLDIPGRPYGFGILRRAQAQGDLEALDRHGRRVLRVHLGADAARGLGELTLLLEKVLPGLEAREAMR